MSRLNISAWSIRTPMPSIVLFMVLIALGIFSFNQLPITRFPNVDVPVVAIAVTQPGAAPSELETQITKKVEDAVAGIIGVKHINSNVVEGTSTTTIQFELATPIDRAVNDAKDAVARIRTDLPRSIEEPIIQRIDIEGLPILTYAASAPTMTEEELSWFVDDPVVPHHPKHQRRVENRTRRRQLNAKFASPSIQTAYWPLALPRVMSIASFAPPTLIWLAGAAK